MLVSSVSLKRLSSLYFYRNISSGAKHRVCVQGKDKQGNIGQDICNLSYAIDKAGFIKLCCFEAEKPVPYKEGTCYVKNTKSDHYILLLAP